MLEIINVVYNSLFYGPLLLVSAVIGLVAIPWNMTNCPKPLSWALCWVTTLLFLVVNSNINLPDVVLEVTILNRGIQLFSIFCYAWLANLLVFRTSLTREEQLVSWLPVSVYMVLYSTFLWGHEAATAPYATWLRLADIIAIMVVPPLAVIAYRQWKRPDTFGAPTSQ